MSAEPQAVTSHLTRRYVLAIGSEATTLAEALGTSILRRLPEAVVVEADATLALALGQAGEYVHVYKSPLDALRALALFDHSA